MTPLIVDPGTNAGMPILYDNPAEVGADRIVNGVAAYEQLRPGAGAPLIVVDFGTATTFDAITAKGEYLGGAICPGVQISADALFQRAARLPRIDVRKPAQRHRPDDRRRDGVRAVLRLRRHGRGAGSPDDAELGGDAICVATGGLAPVIAPETRLIESRRSAT